MNNLTNIQIERINNIFKNIYKGYEKEFETLDDKIEAITQYYESAGFDFKTENDVLSLYNIFRFLKGYP